MLHTVKKAKYLDGYRVQLSFDDKKVKIVDLQDMLKDAKNMFLALKEINFFKKVKSDGTTLVWPNGVDLCPDVLYEMGKTVTVRKKTSKPPSSSDKPQTRIAAKSKR